MLKDIFEWMGKVNILDCTVNSTYHRDALWVREDDVIEIFDSDNKYVVKIRGEDIIETSSHNNTVTLYVLGVGKISLTGWGVVPLNFNNKP